MKAIIIAAGLGSRLLPLTKDTPKSMLPVRGKPMLHYALSHFIANSITDVSIVVGYAAEKIRQNTPYPVTFFHNTRYAQNNILHSLFTASQKMDGEFICSYADIIYDAFVLQALLASKEDISVVIDIDWQKNYIGRSRHPDTEAEKVICAGNRISHIGKYVPTPHATGEFIGMAKFSAKGAQIWKEVFADAQKRYALTTPFQHAAIFEKAYLTDLFQELIDRGFSVHAVLIQGGWREIDTYEDYLRAGGDLRI